MPFDPAMAAWINSAIAFPGATLLVIALAAVFPTDGPKSDPGRVAIVLAAVAATLVFAGGLLRPGPMPLIWRYESPFGWEGLAPVGVLLQLLGWLLVVVAPPWPPSAWCCAIGPPMP